MKNIFARTLALLLIAGAILAAHAGAAGVAFAAEEENPLSAWTDNKTRSKILDFVSAITNPENADFVPQEDRIAVFDLDGTLLPEQPEPFVIAYAYNRFQLSPPPAPAMSDAIDEYIANGNLETAMALNAKRSLEILFSTFAEDKASQLRQSVSAWLDTPYPDPRLEDFRWRDTAYLPMRELLAYLRANGFQTYLVTGSEQEFARAVGAELFGFRPEHVIGSDLRNKFEEKGGKIAISREAKLSDLNEGVNKALNIQSRIGRAPILAAGNSDGDLEMLKLATQAQGKRLGIIIQHTDAEREFAYDREAKTGKLRKGLDQAKANGWLVVSMQKDWATIFADPSSEEPESGEAAETPATAQEELPSQNASQETSQNASLETSHQNASQETPPEAVNQ